MPDNPRISIIIPTLNEAELLDQSLNRLLAMEDLNQTCEVIICDGGSKDATCSIAKKHNCRVINCAPGRARQMNAASESARGHTLLFLHADSDLPPHFAKLFNSEADWGFFRVRLSGKSLVFRIIEFNINLRTSLSNIAGGDQGLYFERNFFTSIGGFPDIPLMEDIAICKKARRQSKPGIIKTALITSSRRWQHHGVIKTVLTMWGLRFAFWIGVDPARLHKIYYPGKSSLREQ